MKLKKENHLMIGVILRVIEKIIHRYVMLMKKANLGIKLINIQAAKLT